MMISRERNSNKVLRSSGRTSTKPNTYKPVNFRNKFIRLVKKENINEPSTSQINNNSTPLHVTDNKSYISEVCALSYLRNGIVGHKSRQFYSKKTVSEIYELVDNYFKNSKTFTSKSEISIDIKNDKDLSIFLYSQYIDILHDTKGLVDLKQLNTFNDFMNTLVKPCLKKLNNGKDSIIEDLVKKVIHYQVNFNFEIKHSSLERDYYNFIISYYTVTDTTQVQNSTKTNRSRYVVFDQSNTNMGRIFSNRYKIILPIPSLADAGMFTNPECHFWKDLRSYIDDNYGKSQNYDNDFTNLVKFYAKYKGINESTLVKEGRFFLENWKNKQFHLKYNVNTAFKNFKLKYKLDQGTIKVPTTITHSGPVHYINSDPVEACFDSFNFNITYKGLTIMKAIYNTHDMSKLSNFKKDISRQKLKQQIGTLQQLFTRGMYNVAINGEPAAIQSKKDAYADITKENMYQQLLQKHLGDLGPQIWAIANDTFYCTGDISGVCQYLVLADLVNKSSNTKVHGPFFETGTKILYLQSGEMKYHKTNKGFTNSIAENIVKFFNNSSTKSLNTFNKKAMVKYILKKPRNKTANASQSPRRPGATPNRSVQRS